MTKKITKNEVVKTIEDAKNIAIFTHLHPDADAYGSAFTMQEICLSFGKNAEIFSLGNGNYLSKIFPLEKLREDFDAKNFDLVIVLDLHALYRLDEPYREKLKSFENILVIDHHKDMGEPSFDNFKSFSNHEKAATCEILTDFCKDEKIKISNKMATYLFAGLIGDTGRFLHSNLTENVLDCAKILLSCGAEAQKVYDQMFRSYSKEEMALHCDFLQKIRYVCGGRGSYVIYTQNDMKKQGIDCNSVKNFTQDLVQIDGVQVGVLCMEYSKNHYKFSVRSNGVNSLNVVCRLGGGGHENASGFRLDITKRQIRKKLPVWIAEMIGVEDFLKKN